MGEAYILGDDAAQRLRRAVRQVERDGVTPQGPDTSSQLGKPFFVQVRVTGAAVNDGSASTCGYAMYPAVVLVWDSSTYCLTDGANVWATELNGNPLASGSRYTGMFVEHSRTPSGESAKPLAVVRSVPVGCVNDFNEFISQYPGYHPYFTFSGLTTDCLLGSDPHAISGDCTNGYDFYSLLENKSYSLSNGPSPIGGGPRCYYYFAEESFDDTTADCNGDTVAITERTLSVEMGMCCSGGGFDMSYYVTAKVNCEINGTPHEFILFSIVHSGPTSFVPLNFTETPLTGGDGPAATLCAGGILEVTS